MSEEVKKYIKTGILPEPGDYLQFKNKFASLSEDELNEINNVVLKARPIHFKNKSSYIAEEVPGIFKSTNITSMVIFIPMLLILYSFSKVKFSNNQAFLSHSLDTLFIKFFTPVDPSDPNAMKRMFLYIQAKEYAEAVPEILIYLLVLSYLTKFAYAKQLSYRNNIAYQKKINYINDIEKRIENLLELILACRTPQFLARKFTNSESFLGENLLHYPIDQVFVTEDNYCLIIEEIIQFYEKQSRLNNPYTNYISEKDYEKLVSLESIKACINSHIERQQRGELLISDASINELKILTEGLLNKEEITRGSYQSVEFAENAYDAFDKYYKSLNEDEREALNEYWIKGFKTIHLMGIMSVSGMNPIQFKDLYSTMNAQCVHTLGAAMIQLLLQPNLIYNLILNPK